MTSVRNETLTELGQRIQVPAYDRASLRPGIAHFGVGNFHRAHQCVYLDDRFASGLDQDWGVVGLSVRSEDKSAFADMREQDALYTVTEVDQGVSRTRVVGSIVSLVEPGDRDAILATLRDPQIRIVSLTVTEGGYFISGEKPDLDHPDLQADTKNLDAPRTVFGMILNAIRARREAGAPPFTVLCCDNLPHNGDLTRGIVTGLAERVDADLAAFVSREIAFPNSMVDRITPATRPDQIETLARDHDVDDKRPVFCEPFIQWVIEDRFSAGRPELEAVGVTFVEDVTPFELMKLRILNAGHATIAYPSALLGLTYAHDAMGDDLVSRFFEDVERNYLLPASPEIEGVSRESYLETVTHRFANPAILDTIRRLCLDGSNRQPKFVIPALREFLAAGRDVSGLAMVQALWCRYCYGELEDGTAIEPNDPNWDALQAAARAARTEPHRFLELRDVFGDLADNEPYREIFRKHVSAIWEKGTRQAIEDYLTRKVA